ncbi:unnamed protein product [Mesocestoides corti]|uniref:Uncharacterized protein n=1 Tax=Mesocestoides corti TaxID=53468 RepID=A0A0R3U983_MESCO|nr:unnamed protein product [Mesocestoides corti]
MHRGMNTLGNSSGNSVHGRQHHQHPQQFYSPAQQGNPNWTATTQFVNRAKQTALQQCGNHQLAALFASPPGGQGCRSGTPEGFMRPPFPAARMAPGLQPAQQQQPKLACQCSICGEGGGNPFQGVGPFNQEPQQPRGGGVMTFTSHLTGLPIPEHPSGVFPSIDYVMVPPGAGSNTSGGGGGGVGGGAYGCNCSQCAGGGSGGAAGPAFTRGPQQCGWNGPQDICGFRCGNHGQQMNALF